MIRYSFCLKVKNSEEPGIEVTYDSNAFPELPLGKTYDMGIDQSTTCTGITIRDKDRNFTLTVEVFNETRDPNYIKSLISYLKKHYSKYRYRLIFLEEEMGWGSGLKTKLLSGLRKDIQNTIEYNFTYNQVKPIPVNVWREGVYENAPGPIVGDKRKKETAIQEIIKQFPYLEKFVFYSNKDCDGIESLGILEGGTNKYLINNSLDGGIVKNVGTITHSKKGFLVMKYAKVNDSEQEFTNLVNLLKSYKLDTALQIKTYDDDHNAYSNFKMALSSDLSVLLIDEEMPILSCLLMLDECYKEGYMLYTLVFSSKIMSKTLVQELINLGYNIQLFH